MTQSTQSPRPRLPQTTPSFSGHLHGAASTVERGAVYRAATACVFSLNRAGEIIIRPIGDEDSCPVDQRIVPLPADVAAQLRDALTHYGMPAKRVELERA